MFYDLLCEAEAVKPSSDNNWHIHYRCWCSSNRAEIEMTKCSCIIYESYCTIDTTARSALSKRPQFTLESVKGAGGMCVKTYALVFAVLVYPKHANSHFIRYSCGMVSDWLIASQAECDRMSRLFGNFRMLFNINQML